MYGLQEQRDGEKERNMMELAGWDMATAMSQRSKRPARGVELVCGTFRSPRISFVGLFCRFLLQVSDLKILAQG